MARINNPPLSGPQPCSSVSSGGFGGLPSAFGPSLIPLCGGVASEPSVASGWGCLTGSCPKTSLIYYCFLCSHGHFFPWRTLLFDRSFTSKCWGCFCFPQVYIYHSARTGFLPNAFLWCFREAKRSWGTSGGDMWHSGQQSLSNPVKRGRIVWEELSLYHDLIQSFFEWYQRMGFLGGASGKEASCHAGDMILKFHPWVGKIPWRRAWQPTPVFLPGEFHGLRILASCSPQGRKEFPQTHARKDGMRMRLPFIYTLTSLN